MLFFKLLSPGTAVGSTLINLLQNIFDSLINSYIDHKIGIVENFLSAPLALRLKNDLVKVLGDNQFHSAGTGNNQGTQIKLLRSDVIYWLDRKHNTPQENEFFNLVDAFVCHLNKTCYTGITGYEFHYALYEKGTFYKKHIDQFRNNDSRKYSMIMYLNDGWQDGDGGELNIHHADRVQSISPVNGKSVFFKSNELEHEVLMTHKPRMSITGWLKVE